MGIAGMILLVWDRKGLFPARGVEQFKSAVQWSRKKFGNTAFFACIQLHDRPRQAVKSAGVRGKRRGDCRLSYSIMVLYLFSDGIDRVGYSDACQIRRFLIGIRWV